MHKLLKAESGVVHTIPLLIVIAAIGVISFLLISSSLPLNGLFGLINPKPESYAAFVAPTPMPGCALGTTTPAGQANPSVEYEPYGAIWCFPLAAAVQPTRIAGVNDWVDEFNINQQMVQFKTGDMDYRVYDKAHGGANPNFKSGHYLNANHWMDDNANAGDDGALLSPNKAFKFENGKLIVEADVAAGIPEYDDPAVWPEIDISMSPNGPTGDIVDPLYGYGSMGGFYTLGCRLHSTRNVVCALESGLHEVVNPTSGEAPCARSAPSRLIEMSGGQVCGSVHKGGGAYAPADQYFRRCQPNQMDIFCRDRFRMELSKDGLVLYINGFKYFEDSNWPAAAQLPDSAVNGNWYVYFTDWQDIGGAATSLYRFHWDRVAINPHDIPGHIQPPTAAPSFCFGQPGNACPLVTTQNPGQPAVSNDHVDILDYVFNSSNITINAGQTVTWTNKSSSGLSHSVDSDTTGLFTSGDMLPGAVYTHTFNTPGVYSYHCLPHPGMIGTVTVLPGSGSPLPSSTVGPSPTPAPTPVTVGQIFSASLTGVDNVPVVTTNGTGNAILILSADHKTATLTMSYSGLTSPANAAHIHGPATTTQNAVALFPLNFPTNTSGFNQVTTITNITTQQVSDLQNGLWYVNVHSANFPSGEIRGQLYPSAIGTGNATNVDDSIIGTGVNQFNYISPTNRWSHCTNCGLDLYNGSNSWNNKVDDSLTLSFNGTQVALYGVKDTVAGIGGLSIDGGAETKVDFYGSARIGNQLLWISPIVTSGNHTLKLRVTGTSNSNSLGIYMIVDRAAVVTSGVIPTPSTCPKGPLGDSNCDGAIDIQDYNNVFTDFGKSGSGILGDIDKNGVVDIQDYNAVYTNFGK